MIDYEKDYREKWLDEVHTIPDFSLNPDQSKAIAAIMDWLVNSNSPYFLLSGAAGTGKTFTVQDLVNQIDGKIAFTAPTNKATKVLRSALTSDEYKPICRTIYSLLGLRMEANGAVKQLSAPEDPVDLSSIKLVVVDEASMVNKTLMREIEKASNNYGRLRFLFMGDKNQLPPVNEKASLVWSLPLARAELKQVMRFDNQILTLARRIEKLVDHPAPSIKLENDNDEIEGVWHLPHNTFRQALIKAARQEDFSDSSKLVKAIAWRNATVAGLNEITRGQIFDNANENRWMVGDRIILTGPAADLDGRNIGCTDDEGTVEKVEITFHPIYQEFMCYQLSVITDENKRISLWILHEQSDLQFRIKQNQMAGEAKLAGRKWKDYWAFVDSFHKVQYGYAITAHRAQGSTYDSCYVVWNDILLNRNRGEAFRCLYVAATRPKKKLILGGW